MFIPLLLYADDLVLVGRSRELAQRLLDALAVFCSRAGLTVNLAKTVWLVGGLCPRDFVPGSLWYHGEPLH